MQLEVVGKLRSVPQSECEKPPNTIPKRFCAATDPTPQPVWDLGSPLLCKEKHLVGMASYWSYDTVEQKNDGTHLPRVYSHMVEFKQWVDTMGEGESNVHDNQHPDC